MNQSIRTVILGACLLASAACPADAQRHRQTINNPVTQAVFRVYQEQLNQNPKNYDTLLRRANDYYHFDEFRKALDDVSRAIECTPSSQTDHLFREYLLRASIYNKTGRHELAIPDLQKACQLEPASQKALSMKAHTELETGKLVEAKADFLRLKRLNMRDPEATLGLARIAMQENNLGMANDYLEEAVALDPNNPDIYVRRARVRQQMNQPQAAVDDLLLALGTKGGDTQSVIDALMEFSHKDYPSTIASLSNAVAQVPDNGMYRYLRASIEKEHAHYLDAINDYQYILDNNLDNYRGIYGSIAECQFALGRLDDALNNVEYALTTVSGNGPYHLLRARILRHKGQLPQALKAAADALAAMPENGDALAEMALIYAEQGNFDESMKLFGEASMNHAEEPMYYLLRANVLENSMNQPNAARGLYRRAAGLDVTGDNTLRSLSAFARLFAGDDVAEITAQVENELAQSSDTNGYLNYLAACFFAQADDFDRALAAAEKSLKNGYANYYNWTEYSDGRVNCAPLRDDLRFLQLLHRNKSLFTND
ncbi:MAG: tetratricopeptide repeat protein [Muribaculaceae bacterium]|nr:tetratricopeptide repeat protein [Muribaculaceae bacterium]